MSERTIDRKASNTAGYTCFSRACATREENPHLRGPDHMAEIFLPLFARAIMMVPAAKRFFMKRIAPPGIYEYVLARTKLVDEVFVRGLESGVDQIVVLGAGMDTRAMRFDGANRGTRIFELDAEKTQRPKLEILERKGVTIPAELTFVPIDFNRQSLSEALFAAGFEKGRRNLFLWEGVTMYLNADAVDGTLRFIRENSAPGSQVAFDYIYASVLRREGRYYGEQGIHERVSKAGEGWTFGVEEGQIEEFLADRGFSILSHHTAADLETDYLTADDGTRLGRINGTHCVVQARAE